MQINHTKQTLCDIHSGVLTKSTTGWQMTGITNAETVRIHRLLWVDQQANYAKIATASRKRFRCAKNEFFCWADWEKYTNPIVNFGLTKGSTETLWEWTNLHISVLLRHTVAPA
jgi:hypothetical protein